MKRVFVARERMKPVRGLIVIFFVLSAFSPLTGETKKDSNWYYDEAQKAIVKENYEYAVKTLREGIGNFPGIAKLDSSLGDLYYKKKFYELALGEYLEADKKQPKDYATMNQIQKCYGYLNDEDKSIDTLKRMLDEFPLEKHPSSYNTVDDLGWMYYKTHRLEEGEKLILTALEKRDKYDINKGLRMTLGTIYSGMYEYEKSKKFYMEAIRESEEDGDKYFTSIAYYNLSLLEHNFYHYNSALMYTDKALQNEERSTGHLSKGELYQSQMNYRQALDEYLQGMKNDDTPLTQMNLAVLYRLFGKLESGLDIALKVGESKDQTWMFNFGTDTDRNKKELYGILSDTFEALSHMEKLLPQATITDVVSSSVKNVWYHLAGYYYKQRYRIYAIKVGKEYLKEHNVLDAYKEFYNANEDYTDVALKFLGKASDIETALAPHSRTFYLQETGHLKRSREMIRESLGSLDPFWEKEAMCDSLRYLVELSGKNTAEGRKCLNRIYEINPGGILQAGYGLPLRLTFDLTGRMRLAGYVVPKLLSDAGSDITMENLTTNLDEGYKYVLSIKWHEGENPTFILLDSEKESIVKQGKVEIKTGNPNELLTRFVRKLIIENIYNVGN